MVTDLYQYVSNQNFNNRQEVYGYLASQVDSQTLSQQEIESKFLEREAMGNIEIAQGVVLPHFEGAINRNKIIIIKPKHTIVDWSDTIVQVDLVIALMLTNGSDKSEVIDFVKNLASDDFIEKLKHKN